MKFYTKIKEDDDRMTGKIHSIDTFSTLDGPGIRTVIFMQGCHLRCKYCHNPDTWKLDDPSTREYTVDELMKIIKRSKPYFRASGGGVTFSGGEPLLQHKFVKEIFIKCRKEHISTALDSSLYIASDIVTALLPYTDLVLADIKLMDEEKSRRLTGAGNRLILENIKLINEHGTSIWIRYVVVPGWTDAAEDIESMANFIAGLECVKRLELLPYHPFGSYKWDMLGLKYELEDISPPGKESLKKIAEQISSASNKKVYIH